MLTHADKGNGEGQGIADASFDVYLTAQGYFVVISNGFFAQRSVALDSALVIVTAFAVHVNVLWIPVQFAYRYSLLCLRGARKHAVNRAIATFAIAWNTVAFVVIYAVLKPHPEFQERGLQMLQMNRWPLANGTTAENIAVFGAHLTSARLISWEILWSISSIGGAAFVFWCETNMVKHFRVGDIQHRRTRQMHREFHRALLAMAICPIITTAIPISYYIITIGLSLCPGPISAFLSTATSSITAFNPLTTIFFMRCYRNVVLKKFCKPSAGIPKASATSAMTGMSALERSANVDATPR